MFVNLFKVFTPITITFALGILLTPLLTFYLYKYQMWKKRAGKIAPDGREATIFNGLHKNKEVGTPRMGGIIIWASVLLTVFFLWLYSTIFPSDLSFKLRFLSRNQTWLPLFTLVVASIIGLIDDWLEVRGTGTYLAGGGMPFKKRLLLVAILGAVGAWWFYFKLEQSSVLIPFLGEFAIGWWIMPLFVITMVGLFSSGVIDGLDGLAGGVMAIIFAAYTGIAYFQNQIDLAALCAAITGGTLAFLWFNIPPARFYMSETGILGLTTTLTVITFLTETVFLLPIIAMPLLLTTLSVIIQLSSKKLRNGKKVFLVAPLHHHFEAKGWSASKVVMRYWIFSIVFAVVGMIISLIGQ